MNYLKKSFLIITLFIGLTSFAQEEPFYKSYDWDKNPNYEINVSDSIEIITYKDKTVKEFYFINDNESSSNPHLHRNILRICIQKPTINLKQNENTLYLGQTCFRKLPLFCVPY